MRRIAASVKRRPVLLASLLTATLLVMCERYHASATIKVVNDAGVTLQNVQLKGPCFVRTGVAMDPGAFKTYWVFPCGEHACRASLPVVIPRPDRTGLRARWIV